ncbi:GNAT family N-acetyltransferase [Ruegeria arenilitoris]|uniref:GNAT family N-acetyltransferase n=1 Tax=Ruegeria arenilitoris TaxID=1173585 RepID=UPI00147A1226|nr:GNAT family N-acetyltransferase [Ruegeria arenilitoris]
MTYDVRFVTELRDADAYHALMTEYFQGIASRLSAAGGPELSPAKLADETLAHVEETLPPKGRLAFAYDDDGRIVGTGSFRLINEDTAEFKRTYVRPEAQRTGLGRKLLEARLSEARAIGCRRILADTVKGNVPMLSLYEHYGFSYVQRYPGNFNPPELDPFLVYLECILPDSGQM